LETLLILQEVADS